MSLPVVIGYSGGGQSRSLLELVLREEVPRPEHLLVTCADTGGEHGWTYDEIDATEEACRKEGIDFVRCAAETSLEADMLAIGTVTRADHPPFWIAKGDGRGRAMQRCTRFYKVAPMRRAVRAWLDSKGLAPRVEKWIGFASDEAHRAQKAAQAQDVAWESLRFPLIERGWRKSDVSAFLGRHVPFSMCVFCPYKDTSRHLQASEADQARAVAVDEAIRDLDCIGLTDGPAYVSDQLIPVSELLRDGPRQQSLPYYGCTGGHCFL